MILFGNQLSHSVVAEFPAGGIDVPVTVQLNLPKTHFLKVC